MDPTPMMDPWSQNVFPSEWGYSRSDTEIFSNPTLGYIFGSVLQFSEYNSTKLRDYIDNPNAACYINMQAESIPVDSPS